MSKHRLFVTGTDTEVGKTLFSAILTEALEADYWKPIQSGDLDYSDSDRVRGILSREVLEKVTFFPNAYGLKTPMSPHESARLDGIEIDISKIKTPQTENHLVIEGAGGVLVPLNSKDTIIDIIQPEYKTIIVSKNYLGSINHTLLTFEALKNRNVNVVGIIFNGIENPSTESIILEKTGLNCIGRIEEEKEISPEIVKKYADKFRENILSCL